MVRTPTLLELCKIYTDNSYKDSDDTIDEKDREQAIQTLALAAVQDPVGVIKLAFLLDPILMTFNMMTKVVAPFANDIPDNDLETLRHATAYIAANSILDFTAGPPNESHVPIYQALAMLFKKLSRTAGQENETRALADHFCNSYIPLVESDNIDISLINCIAPFTTMGIHSESTRKILAAAKKPQS